LFRSPSALRHSCQYLVGRAAARVVNLRDRWLDPPALAFFRTMRDGGFDPDAHIDVLPRQRLIYISVPKCASTTIKSALSALQRGVPPPADKLHTRRYSGLKSPKQVGLSTFHRLANSTSTLRFAFVRNPYARLVSAWADKFQNKPLVKGDSFVDLYLAHRPAIDAALPQGADQTLSFAQFVEFAAASSECRLNAHWQTQDDLLNMPGITLDFVGKVETFRADFARVLDHGGADQQLRQTLGAMHNASRHRPWPDYYNDALAARVQRAYACDFDRFGYPRAIGANGAA
jgi:Sulfotransferase family